MIIDAVFGFGFTRSSTSNISINKASTEARISSFGDFVQQCSDTAPAEQYISSIRNPFKDILDIFRLYSIQAFQNKAPSIPIISIDVPSGWDVDQDGNLGAQPISLEYTSASFTPYFTPTVLISLSYPKRCAYAFETIQALSNMEKTRAQARYPPMKHYLGGRFIPKYLQQRYGFSIGSTLHPVFTSGNYAVTEPLFKKAKNTQVKDVNCNDSSSSSPPTVWYHGSEQITEIVQHSMKFRGEME